MSLGCLSVFSGITGAGPTDKPVSAHELPYELLPAKVAVILYKPSVEGVYSIWWLPLISLVALPMSIALPFVSIANSVTGTPVTVKLCQYPSIECCICKYLIYVVIDSSDMHDVLG
jgi:hypothetical protein